MSSFSANFAGIGEMLRSDFIKDEMDRRAKKVKAQAEATAPVHTGEYKDSFTSRVEVKPTGAGRSGKVPRAVGVVENTSAHANLVEFVDGYRTLGKALDAARD